VRGKTPRLLTQTPLCERGMKNKSHHIESVSKKSDG